MFSYFGLIDHRDGGVMDDAAVAGKHLSGLNPSIFREICGHVDVFVVVLSSLGDQEFRNG